MTQKTQEQKPLAQQAQDAYDTGGEAAMWQLLQAHRAHRPKDQEQPRPQRISSGLVFLEDGSVVKHNQGEYRFAWTQDGELQTGERDTKTKPGRALAPEEHPQPTYDWPESEDLHQAAMRIISKEAHDQMRPEWFTTEIPELEEHESYAAVPELRKALMDAISVNFPSDRLARMLDEETTELAHTALDSLTGPQREVLVKTAASMINEQALLERADREKA